MNAHLLALLSLAVVAGACRNSGDQSPPTTTTSLSASASSSASAAIPPSSGVHTVLDAMDQRTPVPLLPMMANHQKANMRDHLLAVQEITTALAGNDFAAVEKSAGRIGYSEQMGQMCTHMGAGASGFTEMALAFHHTADTIAEAAKKRDANAVLTALTRTLATCTSCHAKFKQQVVDEATWASLTGQAAPSKPAHP